MALDLQRPGSRAEVFRQAGRLVLVGRELVEIVVVGDVFVGGLLLIGTERTLHNAGDLVPGFGGERKSDVYRSGSGQRSSSGEELAPVQVDALTGDLRRRNISRFPDQHRTRASSLTVCHWCLPNKTRPGGRSFTEYEW